MEQIKKKTEQESMNMEGKKIAEVLKKLAEGIESGKFEREANLAEEARKKIVEDCAELENEAMISTAFAGALKDVCENKGLDYIDILVAMTRVEMTKKVLDGIIDRGDLDDAEEAEDTEDEEL